MPLAIVEIAEPGISVGLKDAGVTGKMPCGVLGAAIASRRTPPPAGPVRRTAGRRAHTPIIER
jgi:hypothetical protein